MVARRELRNNAAVRRVQLDLAVQRVGDELRSAISSADDERDASFVAGRFDTEDVHIDGRPLPAREVAAGIVKVAYFASRGLRRQSLPFGRRDKNAIRSTLCRHGEPSSRAGILSTASKASGRRGRNTLLGTNFQSGPGCDGSSGVYRLQVWPAGRQPCVEIRPKR